MIRLEQSGEEPAPDHPQGQIVFSNINLENSYRAWGDKEWESFNESSIKEHVNEWINLHEVRRKSIRSLTGKEIAWVLVIPVGILDNTDKFKLIGGLYLGLDEALIKPAY